MDADGLAEAAHLGFTTVRQSQFANLNLRLTVLRPPPGLDPERAYARLSVSVPASRFEINTTYDLAAGPCANAGCYGRAMIGWPATQSSCAGGARIGMVDTGIDDRSTSLARAEITERSFAGAGQASAEQHGTAVAAILVGQPVGAFAGLAPPARLYAADVFRPGESGKTQADIARILGALDWLAKERVQVINLSLSGPPHPLLAQAMRQLAAKGIVLVAAAGNYGPDAQPAFPAAYPEVISVTAVDRYRRVYALANRGDYIALAAPGVGVWAPLNGTEGRGNSGTSFASAYVTGIVAEALADRPGLSPSALSALLQSHAVDLGTPGKDPVFGWGLARRVATCGG